MNSRSPRKRVLIVDTTATVRNYHRKIFHDSGFETDEAHTSAEALGKAEAHHYDLMLVDVRLPKLEGMAFLRELRSREHGEQIPALAITSRGDACEPTAVYRAGANFCLLKPASPVDLLIAARLLAGA